MANGPNTEGGGTYISPTSTGFKAYPWAGNGGGTIIYIAIRRPMKTPESGTEVFSANFSDGVEPIFSSGFPVDLGIYAGRSNAYKHYFYDRLRGSNPSLNSTNTSAEQNNGEGSFDNMDGWGVGIGSSTDYVSWMFRRAPGFMDVVAYTGTGVAHTEAHNLGVVPELMIVKTRSNDVGWAVSCGAVGYANGGRLESIGPFYSEPNRITGTPTTTTFPVGTDAYVNVSARTYVAYLFATLPGISKVGSYTGNGTSQTIDCGFSAGARFVLIKASSDFGDWNVFDTERGIVAGNDPYLKLNNTDAEATGVDAIDPVSTGFTVIHGGGGYNMPNVNGTEYIFLAIA